MTSMKIIWSVIVVLVLKETDVASEQLLEEFIDNLPEDAKLNFTGLALKYAGKCEEHEVISDDGYILTVFRLPRPGGRPVIIQHGNLGSADDFIIRGPSSLVVALYDAGYDVWATNCRGNRYNQRHVTLTVDNPKFWDYSLQEVAYYDMPATIDYILAKTNNKQLTAIGFSVGTSMFYAMAAERPEYNAKINLLISLAPICYTFNSAPLSAVNFFAPVANQYFASIKQEQIYGHMTGLGAALHGCMNMHSFLGTTTATAICLERAMAFTPGFDSSEIEPEFTPIIWKHYPTSVSRKFFFHFGQIGPARRFVKYDLGFEGNLVEYGTIFPPEYDLSQVTMPIALISGKADTVSTLADVELLKRDLPNVVDHIILEPENFGHLHYMWARHAPEMLHPYVFDLLDIYS